MAMNDIVIFVRVHPRWRSHPTRRQEADRAHTQRSTYTTIHPGTRMRLRLHLWMRVVVAAETATICLDVLFSASSEEETEEDDIDIEYWFKYEYEHDLDVIERPWRLNCR